MSDQCIQSNIKINLQNKKDEYAKNIRVNTIS